MCGSAVGGAGRYEYPPLVNAALELLLRYYSQRRALTEALSAAQILVLPPKMAAAQSVRRCR